MASITGTISLQDITEVEATDTMDADANLYVEQGGTFRRIPASSVVLPNEGDSHAPTIQGGTWWIWDYGAGQYVDSGVTATIEFPVFYIDEGYLYVANLSSTVAFAIDDDGNLVVSGGDGS